MAVPFIHALISSIRITKMCLLPMEKSSSALYRTSCFAFGCSMRVLIICWILILVGSPAFATVVVRQIDPVDSGWVFGLEGSYANQTGATQKRDYALGFNLSHRIGVNEYRAFGNVNYGRVNGVANTDNAMAHLRYIRSNIIGNLRFEAFTQTENDDFASLSRRDLLGGGISRFFNIENGSRRLLTMLGIMREQETHLSDASQDRDVTRITASVQASWKLPRDNKLYFIAYLQPNLDAMDNDRRITAELSLDIPLSARLKLKTGYHYRYNDEPFDNVPREQTKFSTGFAFQF